MRQRHEQEREEHRQIIQMRRIERARPRRPAMRINMIRSSGSSVNAQHQSTAAQGTPTKTARKRFGISITIEGTELQCDYDSTTTTNYMPPIMAAQLTGEPEGRRARLHWYMWEGKRVCCIQCIVDIDQGQMKVPFTIDQTRQDTRIVLGVTTAVFLYQQSEAGAADVPRREYPASDYRSSWRSKRAVRRPDEEGSSSGQREQHPTEMEYARATHTPTYPKAGDCPMLPIKINGIKFVANSEHGRTTDNLMPSKVHQQILNASTDPEPNSTWSQDGYHMICRITCAVDILDGTVQVPFTLDPNPRNTCITLSREFSDFLDNKRATAIYGPRYPQHHYSETSYLRTWRTTSRKETGGSTSIHLHDPEDQMQSNNAPDQSATQSEVPPAKRTRSNCSVLEERVEDQATGNKTETGPRTRSRKQHRPKKHEPSTSSV